MDRILNHLPGFYKEVKEFQVIAMIETEDIDELQLSIQSYLEGQFIETANEENIARRERLFRIMPDPSTESLEFRRKRIINRQSIKPPFTERYLQQRLDFLLGPGVATVNLDPENYVLTIELAISNAAMFKEVIITIEKIVPLNMIYLQKTALVSKLGINESIVAKTLERTLRLGSNWQVGITPFAEVANEVIVK